jgi:hypothetical protein
MAAKKKMYRVAFAHHGKVYELNCSSVVSSGLWGFVEISGLLFQDGDALVVDPTEEKLRAEFENTHVLHLPLHSVLRVEEVRKPGQAVIRDRESGEKVTPFPMTPPGRSSKH